MTKMRSLTENEYADLAEQVSVEEQLDLGQAMALRVMQEGREFFLVSTASGQYAELCA